MVRGIFQFWMRVILIGISRDIEYDLRNDLFAHLVSLSPDYYARQRTGDIMARATNDLNAVRMMLGPGHHVLDRDQPDLRAGHRRHGFSRLAADAVRGAARARWSAWP